MKHASCIFWLLLITFFSAASSYNVFEENGRVGLKNEQGKVLIPAQYEALGWSDGKFSILQSVTGYKSEGLWGMINLNNQLLTKPVYEAMFPVDGSLLIARRKSNVSLRIVAGCLNFSGKEIIPFQYDGVSISFFRAIVFTKIGNEYKYGLIDLENKTLIPQRYKSIASIGSLRYAVSNFENKIALFTENGKQVTNFNIDSIAPFKKNYAVFHQGSLQGLIDRDGQIKLQPTYREIRIDDDGLLYTRQIDEWLFLDGQNKLIKQKRADSISPIGKNLLSIRTTGTIRVEDYDFNPVFASTFSSLGKFQNGKAIFSVGTKFGVITRSGSVLVKPTFDVLYPDNAFYIGNQKQAGKDHWHVLDSSGLILNNKPYDRIHPYIGKIFPVSIRNFWGAINTSGKEIITCTYDSILQHLNENIVVKFRGQYGIVNLKEEWIITPKANKLKLITDDRFIEITPAKTYLKSYDGNAIYFTENKVQVSNEHIIEYLPSGTIWEIDLNGVIVDRQVQPEGSIEKIFPPSEGLRAIKKNGQYGFVDSQGRLRIANRYDGIQSFSEGLAAIKILGKWGFINNQDKIAIQPVYEEVSSFKDGFSLVKQKGLQGLIDKNGKQVLPMRYESVSVFPHGSLLIAQDKLYGLASAEGKILINPKYHRLEDLNNNYVIVARDGKYGVITLQGISTIPLMYDYISYDGFNDFFIALKKADWVNVRL